MGEVLYWLVNKILFLQFHNTFSTHLSSHQIGVVVMDECATMVYGV
jgi:hypothetical protein